MYNTEHYIFELNQSIVFGLLKLKYILNVILTE